MSFPCQAAYVTIAVGLFVVMAKQWPWLHSLTSDVIISTSVSHLAFSPAVPHTHTRAPTHTPTRHSGVGAGERGCVCACFILLQFRNPAGL